MVRRGVKAAGAIPGPAEAAKPAKSGIAARYFCAPFSMSMARFMSGAGVA